MEVPLSILQLLSQKKDHPVCEIEMKSTTNMKEVSITTMTSSSSIIENNDLETSMPSANTITDDTPSPTSSSERQIRSSSRRWGSTSSNNRPRSKMMIWGTLDDNDATNAADDNNILVGTNRSLVSRDDDIIAMMDTKHSTKLNSSASNSRISRHMQRLEDRKRKLERSKQALGPKQQEIKKTEGTIEKDNNSWWNYNLFSVFNSSNTMTEVDHIERQNHHENDGIFRERINEQRKKGYRPHSLSFDSDVVYTALEQEGYQKLSKGDVSSSSLSNNNNNDIVVVTKDDATSPPSSSSMNDPLFASKETLTQQIQNSCSFFYNSSNNNQSLVKPSSSLNASTSHYNHPWRSIVHPSHYAHGSPSSSSRHHHQQDHQYYNTHNHRPFDYTDAVTILSPPVLQQYRIRYEQLNRPNPSYDDDGDSDDEDYNNIKNVTNDSRMIGHNTDPNDNNNIHDLYLTMSDDNEDDENERTKTTTITNDTKNKNKKKMRNRRTSDTSYTTDTVEVSSLFYKANGRLLMRLPRDRVRLLQDPDLEPGVLSVDEQWNKKPPSSLSDNNTLSSSQSPFIKNLHPNIPLEELHYALTVPDDIYRKVVSEMSYRYSDPLGLYFCCSTTEYTNSNERVDIRVAIWLLIILFLILGFITIYYRED